jgi:signal transduction histidine kinase
MPSDELVRWLRAEMEALPCTPGGLRVGALSLKNGSRVFARSALPSTDVDGTHEVEVVLLEDMARRDRLEGHLVQASRATTTSQVLRSQIHDIRAPLNAIVLNLDLLRSALLDPSDPDHGEPEALAGYLDVARTELMRVNRSLGQLLINADPKAERWRRMDLRRLVRELVRLVRAQAASRGVRIATRLGRDPAPVFGYRDRLKQVSLNVINNAFEAMPKGGHLEVTLHDQGDGFALTFTDTGRGIPLKLQKRVFDLHVTSRSRGSGLGLFVVKSVVEAHGGRVTLDTKPGRGTTLCLYLPRAVGPTNQAEPPLSTANGS